MKSVLAADKTQDTTLPIIFAVKIKITSLGDSAYARLDPLVLEHSKQPMSARRRFGMRRRRRRRRRQQGETKSPDKSFVGRSRLL